MPPLMSPSDVRSEIRMQQADFLARANQRPIIDLYDKNWDKHYPLIGETQARFLEKLNDTGEGNLVIFGNNKLRNFIVDELGEWEDLHIRVRTGLKEWTGKASEVVDESDEEGFEYISIKFLHEYEHVKKIICASNPLFPMELQFPKIWAYAGPAVFGITATIFLNLLRRFALPWTFSDNLFDPSSWVSNFNPENWPIVVVPKPFLSDTSMWSIIATRFGNAHDVFAPTLKDAGIQIKVYRWFPGMPQPAPDHYTLTKPTLVIDVIDKSGYKGPSGTVLDGLAHLVTEVADDLINEVVNEVTFVESPEYSIGGYLGTTRENPWVVFKNAQRSGGISGVQSWKMVRHKATASAIMTGGHSPDWVNSGIKLLMNAALGYLGALIGNPGLALGVFEPMVTDVVLAFHRTPNPVRIEKMGAWGPAYGEYWESTGGTGASLSALQAIRSGFYRTRAYTTFQIKCRAGAPYWPGAHFDTGDRVAGEIGKSGHLYIDNVYSLGFGWGRDSDTIYDVAFGDNQIDDDPGAIFSRQIAMVKHIVQEIGVSA